jgi:hypothetical protein
VQPTAVADGERWLAAERSGDDLPYPAGVELIEFVVVRVLVRTARARLVSMFVAVGLLYPVGWPANVLFAPRPRSRFGREPCVGLPRGLAGTVRSRCHP